eukprot:765043-Hanusia_phi.AAC.6
MLTCKQEPSLNSIAEYGKIYLSSALVFVSRLEGPSFRFPLAIPSSCYLLLDSFLPSTVLPSPWFSSSTSDQADPIFPVQLVHLARDMGWDRRHANLVAGERTEGGGEGGETEGGGEGGGMS